MIGLIVVLVLVWGPSKIPELDRASEKPNERSTRPEKEKNILGAARGLGPVA